MNSQNIALTTSSYYPATHAIISGRCVQLRCGGILAKDVPADTELLIGTLPADATPQYQFIKYVFGGNDASRLFRISIDMSGKVTFSVTSAMIAGTGVNINEVFIAKKK